MVNCEIPAASALIKPKNILSAQKLKTLNTRSNFKGLVQLVVHLSIAGLSGYIWIAMYHWSLKLPALIVYGFSLAAMFAVVHEASHRTAFANNRLNDIVAWWAGVLSGYNSTFYRRFHKWHHRYTQIAGKDPELGDPKPSNLPEYLVEISGLNWWQGKLKTHYQIATGNLEHHPYIAENAAQEVIYSTRLQLAIYGLAIAISFTVGQPWFITYWLLPLAVGQPILRLILLAEHTGCSLDNNPLTNTRTTLTWLPLHLLMWNMPFHAEHHLYPSIPFHALPQAHQELQEYLAVCDRGYLKANQKIIQDLYS
ncbi:MAG: fatty acid desaturase family protein [Cyanobacteria bacterium P01_A01_bin.40]